MPFNELSEYDNAIMAASSMYNMIIGVMSKVSCHSTESLHILLKHFNPERIVYEDRDIALLKAFVDFVQGELTERKEYE